MKSCLGTKNYIWKSSSWRILCIEHFETISGTWLAILFFSLNGFRILLCTGNSNGHVYWRFTAIVFAVVILGRFLAMSPKNEKKGEVYRWILKSKKVGIRKGEKKDSSPMHVVRRNTMLDVLDLLGFVRIHEIYYSGTKFHWTLANTC